MGTPTATERRELAFAGVARQAELVRTGAVTPRELVETALERIAELDPKLNTFRKVFAEAALAEADRAAGRIGADDELPLLGVPIAVKDDTPFGGEPRVSGSHAHGDPEPEDAAFVARLRAAGAIVVGITRTPELAAWPFTETVHGGVTRNPWDLERTPGGSSGGSGAAVAAALVPGATASDGAGSIRIPAACCGLVGLKPQRGRVNPAPAVDPFRNMAVFGALTRTVQDTARIMDVVKDGGPSYASAVAGGPGRLRIAVSVGPPPVGVQPDAEQLAGVNTTAALLRELGHEVAERDFDWGVELGNRVLTRFVRGVADQARDMGHLDRLSRRARGIARLGMMVPDRVVDAATDRAAADAERLNRIFDESDVVLTPMFTRRPLRVREYDGKPGLWTLAGNVRFTPYAGAFNHTGQPAVAVPAGVAGDGFPLGVQLVGPPDAEPRLLALAAQLEQARDWPSHRPAVAA
jgi:amidase